MSLPTFALTNKHTVYALALGIIIFGAIAYVSLPIQLFPDTAPPLVNILTSYPGAAAEDVADLVSEVIEEECGSLEGVYKVTSTSQDGLSLVSVEFTYDTSIDLAAVDVQNALSRIRSKLPAQILEPQVLKFSTSDRPVMTMGLVSDDLVAARRLAEDILAPEIQRVSGVAVVDVFGGHAPELIVQVDRDLLDAHGLLLSDVTRAIREHEISQPAGQIRGERHQYAFRIDEQSPDAARIASTPLTGRGGQRVLVGDVARLELGHSEDLSRYRVDGTPAIALQVFKQDDANTIRVVERTRELFDAFASRYPEIEFLEAEESASFTQQVVTNMLGSVAQALLLASVIIFLFLGSFRRGFVVVVSMPLSFLLTFAVMSMLGIQLDLVTLTAIILAVGMVVDASVVVLENITRKSQQEDLPPEQAAREGAGEVQFAVLAGSLTTIVVLIPLLFLYGFVGKTFGPLAGTMIIAFASSILVALTIVPVLTTFVSGEGGRAERVAAAMARPWDWAMGRLRQAYLSLLRRSLRARPLVLGLSLGLFLAGVVLLRFQGMELLPKMDSGQTFVTVETPAGSSLIETERVVGEVEAVIRSEPAVRRVSSQIGFEPGMHSFGGGGVQGPTQGYISVTLSDRTDRDESIWKIQDRMRNGFSELPGIQTLVVRESGSTAKSTTAASIVASVRGPDPLVLDQMGNEALELVSEVAGVRNPYRTWRLDQETIVVDLDVEQARELRTSPASIAAQLAQALDGSVVATQRDDLAGDTPVRVRYAESFRRNIEDALAVRTLDATTGEVVPVGMLAQTRRERVQGLVTRENLEPTLDVRALHQDRPLSFVSADVQSALDGMTIPEGYSISLQGENRDMAESRDELVRALIISAIAVYLLLVAQFRSFLHPITVLMSVPLSLLGVALALWIAGKPVSMPVMVGLILLVGIVVNNAIILLDFIRQRRTAGMDRQEAIIESVRVRFRPIMMTSLSTIVGMTPLALEWSLGAERFSPLAIAVIGGMTTATFLTLVVIPVLYDSLEDAVGRFRGGP